MDYWLVVKSAFSYLIMRDNYLILFLTIVFLVSCVSIFLVHFSFWVCAALLAIAVSYYVYVVQTVRNQQEFTSAVDGDSIVTRFFLLLNITSPGQKHYTLLMMRSDPRWSVAIRLVLLNKQK